MSLSNFDVTTAIGTSPARFLQYCFPEPRCYGTTCVIDCRCRPMEDCQSGIPIIAILTIVSGVLSLLSLLICYIVARKRRAQRRAIMSQVRTIHVGRNMNDMSFSMRAQMQGMDPNSSQGPFMMDDCPPVANINTVNLGEDTTSTLQLNGLGQNRMGYGGPFTVPVQQGVPMNYPCNYVHPGPHVAYR